MLIVDDDEAIRALVAEILEEAGYATARAAGGREALERARLVRPDLILLDKLMPEGDGTEFAREYRATPPPHAPIVALCAVNDAVEWAASIGAVGHIVKPFDIDDLLAVVAKHAAQRRERSPARPRSR